MEVTLVCRPIYPPSEVSSEIYKPYIKYINMCGNRVNIHVNIGVWWRGSRRRPSPNIIHTVNRGLSYKYPAWNTPTLPHQSCLEGG